MRFGRKKRSLHLSWSVGIAFRTIGYHETLSGDYSREVRGHACGPVDPSGISSMNRCTCGLHFLCFPCTLELSVFDRSPAIDTTILNVAVEQNFELDIVDHIIGCTAIETPHRTLIYSPTTRPT